MQYRTAGTAGLPDADTINGHRYPIQDDTLRLVVSTLRLPTRGLAALWAKVRCDTADAKLKWEARPWMFNTPLDPLLTGTVTIARADAAWQAVPLGLVHLPPVELGEDGGGVEFTFRRDSGAGTLFLDEVWAFGQDDESGLTIVDAGLGDIEVGGPASHMWLDAPSADIPAGRLVVGQSRAVAHTPHRVQSQQVHKFPPRGVAVLAASFGAPPKVSLTHYRRWTHHAGT